MTNLTYSAVVQWMNYAQDFHYLNFNKSPPHHMFGFRIVDPMLQYLKSIYHPAATRGVPTSTHDDYAPAMYGSF
jgi:hypothetical protein